MNILDKLAKDYARKQSSLRTWIDKNYPNDLNREEMKHLTENIITMIKEWTQ